MVKMAKMINNNIKNLITDEFLILSIMLMFLIMLYWLHYGNGNEINMETFISEDEANEGIAEGNEGAENTSNENTDPSLDNHLSNCDPSDKLADICFNMTACCKSDTNECFCKHPITKKCHEQYEKCKSNLEGEPLIFDLYKKQGINDICRNSMSDCCRKFNDVQINTEYQKNDGQKTITKVNKFCGLGSKQNLEDSCSRMCSTYDDCKAYLADSYGCTLFDDVQFSDIVPGAVYNGRKAPVQRAVDGYNVTNLMIKK